MGWLDVGWLRCVRTQKASKLLPLSVPPSSPDAEYLTPPTGCDVRSQMSGQDERVLASQDARHQTAAFIEASDFPSRAFTDVSQRRALLGQH